MVENNNSFWTEQRKTVVVGIDGSDHASHAVKWASDEAKAHDAVLLIVFASSRESEDVAIPPRTSDGSDIVDGALSLVALRHPSVTVECQITHGSAPEVLVAATRTADLLVVGSRGSGGFKELLLGSVSERCIQRAQCPVVIVRSDTTHSEGYSVHQRIMVGIDGSESSNRALLWALQEGAVRHSAVEAVSAYQFAPLTGTLRGGAKGSESAALVALETASLEAESLQSTVSFRGSPRLGDPVPVLLSASEEADLLVLGSGGRGAIQAALLGSVAHQCAHHAPCPVVIMRPLRGAGNNVADQV